MMLSGHVTGMYQDLEFGFAAIPVLATVNYERIARRAGRGDAPYILPVILGCTMAHELGHLLLRDPGHSTTGIMQPRWGDQQTQQALTGQLRFTTPHAKLIRERALVLEEATAPEPSANSYSVLGATPQQEALVRGQIRVMQPTVQPLRIIFVPHWKYVDTARIFRVRVPSGYTSAMFTHLPSRSVFIDSDRYVSDDSLGYWLAHELGHLATNSANESDANKAAREYRKRLKGAQSRYALRQHRRSSDQTALVRPHQLNISDSGNITGAWEIIHLIDD